jgi:L-fuculose-phosphate aldolase
MRSMDRSTAAKAIVRAGARLGRRGLIAAAEGNLSARLDDGSILVTPSGFRKDELEPGDLVVVDPAGSVGATRVGLTPTSDLAIHRAVYAARDDVRAVAHAHLPASMGLTLAGERPDATALPETAALLKHLPFVAYGEMGSDELAGRVAAAFTDDVAGLPVAVLLERHGAVAVGDTPDTAVDRLELVEVLCRAWRDALLVRAARSLPADTSPRD